MTPQFRDWIDKAKVVKIADVVAGRGGLKLKRKANELTGPCPQCGGDDRFAIDIGADVFHCRGCDAGRGVKGSISFVRWLDDCDFLCAVEAITGEPPPKDKGEKKAQQRSSKKPLGELKVIYPYNDETGELLFEVLRYEPKNFRQRRPDPDHQGQWIWNLNAVRLVPYRLPDVIEAIANEQIVFIVEGEKDADTGVNRLGIMATTTAMGAGKWRGAQGDQYAEFFRGADVVIIPDNDKDPRKGRAHATTIAGKLYRLAERVRILTLPGGYKDLTDWVDAVGTREDLDALVDAAPEYMNGFDPGATNEASEEPSSSEPAKIIPIIGKVDFLRGFNPPDYLIDGLLQRGFVYALTGQTGHAKTAVALLLAELVASPDPNTTLGRHKVEKGRVVYFAGENPDDVRMRVIGSDWKRREANNPDDSPDQDQIWFVPGQFNINEMRAYLIERFNTMGGANLIVVDTSAAYFLGKDEIDNVEMGQHARMLRTLTELPGKPCVIPLCHPAKKVETLDQLLPRGGGAFLAELDGNLTLFRKNDGTVELNYTKLRGPGFDPIVFRLEQIRPPMLKDTKDRVIPTVRAATITAAQQEQMEKVLTDTEDTILRAYLANPDITMRGICDQYGISSTSIVSRAINDSLKPTGYMRKDRGSKWILTEKGKEEARQIGLKAARNAPNPEQGEMFGGRK